MVARTPESLAGEVDVEYIDVVGTFREDEEGHENVVENNSLDDQHSSTNKSATGIEMVDSKKIVVFDFDFDQIKSVSALDAVYMNVKLSLNEFDYCPALPANKSVILHTFDPVSLVPACYALDAPEEISSSSITVGSAGPKREVCVCGTGFINTMGLHPGATMEAVLRAKVGKGFGDVVLPIRCYDSERIYFVPPSVEQFVAASGAGLDHASFPTLLNTSIRFQLTCPHEAPPATHLRGNTGGHSHASLPDNSHSSVASGPEIIQLSPRVLRLDLYTPQPVQVQPVICRRVPGIPLTITGAFKGGLKLRSSQSRVQFFNKELGIDYMCDSNDVRMIPIGDQFTDELFTMPQNMDDAATPGCLTERTTTPFEPGADSTSLASASHDKSDNRKTKIKGKKGKAVEAAPVEVEIEYKAVIKLPTPHPDFDTLFEAFSSNPDVENREPVDRSLAPNWKVMNSTQVSLWLDGQTPVPASYAAKVIFFDTLAIKPLPKGPFPPASSLTLEVSGLVCTKVNPADENADQVKCILRFFAEASATTRSPSCDIVCTGSVSAQTITVTLPDAGQFAGLEPEPSGKAAKAKGPKNYFIGISIDEGNTFDYSDKAILPVK
jgi:hypothetical protein